MERISGSLRGLLKSTTVVAGTAPSCHKPWECFLFWFYLWGKKKKKRLGDLFCLCSQHQIRPRGKAHTHKHTSGVIQGQQSE